MKTEFKNGQLIIKFPGSWWVVVLYLVFTPVYAWFSLDLNKFNLITAILFLFFYVLIAGLFIIIYHSVTVEVDPIQRSINQISNFLIIKRTYKNNTSNFTSIILEKTNTRGDKYLLWGFTHKKEFIIGTQINSQDYQSAREAGKKMADFLKIKFEEIER